MGAVSHVAEKDWGSRGPEAKVFGTSKPLCQLYTACAIQMTKRIPLSTSTLQITNWIATDPWDKMGYEH